MILTKKLSKHFFRFALMFSVLFSGQNIGHAEDQYTEDLIPEMTSDSSPSGVVNQSSIYTKGEYNVDYYGWMAFNNKIDLYDGWFVQRGSSTGWLSYQFTEPKQIEKYTITARSYRDDVIKEWPKDWTFEGYDQNLSEWIILDKRVGITDWSPEEKKDFTFANSNKYSLYRINITASNDGIYMGFGEMEMMEKKTNDPDPDPKPEPTGDNALLVIKMISGLEKEFDLTASEVQDFIDWYDGRADGRGKETYMFDKDFNKGPFTSRKDYVAFSKIQSFEVMEYTK